VVVCVCVWGGGAIILGKYSYVVAGTINLHGALLTIPRFQQNDYSHGKGVTFLACARALSTLCAALDTTAPTDGLAVPASTTSIARQPRSPIATDAELLARAVSAIRASESVLRRALSTAAYVALASNMNDVRTL
jgi:hypothetical protein